VPRCAQNEELLDMEKLAEFPREKLVGALNILTEDYGKWIAEQNGRIPGELGDSKQSAEEVITRCSEVLSRLKEGIAVLQNDDQALEAFRFANKAMARQNQHLFVRSPPQKTLRWTR
jgi:hypothetical protein